MTGITEEEKNIIKHNNYRPLVEGYQPKCNDRTKSDNELTGDENFPKTIPSLSSAVVREKTPKRPIHNVLAKNLDDCAKDISLLDDWIKFFRRVSPAVSYSFELGKTHNLSSEDTLKLVIFALIDKYEADEEIKNG